MGILPSKEPLAVAQADARRSVRFVIFLIGLRLVLTALLFFNPKPGIDPSFYAFSLVDCLILAGFGYGIHRMSRICAVLFLAYVAADEAYKYQELGSNAGSLFNVLLLVASILAGIRAIIACFRFHSLKKKQLAEQK